MSSLEVEKKQALGKTSGLRHTGRPFNFDDAYTNCLRQLVLLISRILTFNYYQDKLR